MPPKNKSPENDSVEPECKKPRIEEVEKDETKEDTHTNLDNGNDLNSVSEDSSDAEKIKKKVILLHQKAIGEYIFKLGLTLLYLDLVLQVARFSNGKFNQAEHVVHVFCRGFKSRLYYLVYSTNSFEISVTGLCLAT